VGRAPRGLFLGRDNRTAWKTAAGVYEQGTNTKCDQHRDWPNTEEKRGVPKETGNQ